MQNQQESNVFPVSTAFALPVSLEVWLHYTHLLIEEEFVWMLKVVFSVKGSLSCLGDR